MTEQLGVAPHLEAHHRAERENLELERLEKYALLRLLYDFTDAPDDINDDIDNQKVDERTLDLILKTPGAHLATATGKLPPAVTVPWPMPTRSKSSTSCGKRPRPMASTSNTGASPMI